MFELRRVPPDVFGPGAARDPPWLAIPEKAAFDWAYQAARGGFESARFPEIGPVDGVDEVALAAFVANIRWARPRRVTARILGERMCLSLPTDIVQGIRHSD